MLVFKTKRLQNEIRSFSFTPPSCLIMFIFYLSSFHILLHSFQFLVFSFAWISFLFQILNSIPYYTADVMILMKNKVIKKWKNAFSLPHTHTQMLTQAAVLRLMLCCLISSASLMRRLGGHQLQTTPRCIHTDSICL